MQLLYEILDYNKQFIENKEFEKYNATRFPFKKLIVLSCMDTRLTELLPKAMNLRNGDAKFIKDAGAIVTHPFGSVMRSMLIAIYELGAEEICVIGHHGCGMGTINPAETIQTMVERGISKQTIELVERCGIDLKTWLHGFDCVEESVQKSVAAIKNHPLMLTNFPVHGLVVDPETGKLDVVVDGYKELE